MRPLSQHTNGNQWNQSNCLLEYLAVITGLERWPEYASEDDTAASVRLYWSAEAHDRKSLSQD